jgi:hypothetical protein
MNRSEKVELSLAERAEIEEKDIYYGLPRVSSCECSGEKGIGWQRRSDDKENAQSG